MDKPTDETKISLIQKDINYIQKDIASINDSLKGLNTIFASKEELRTVAAETERRLCSLESSHFLWKWLSPSIAAVFGSVVTFLLISYLGHIKGI